MSTIFIECLRFRLFICEAGFFYWVDQVQPYDQGGWSYMDELHKFVENGLEGEDFINSVSGIVNR